MQTSARTNAACERAAPNTTVRLSRELGGVVECVHAGWVRQVVVQVLQQEMSHLCIVSGCQAELEQLTHSHGADARDTAEVRTSRGPLPVTIA